jgi:hypothetical protein
MVRYSLVKQLGRGNKQIQVIKKVEPKKEKIIKAFANRVVETVCGEILTIHGIRCRMMRYMEIKQK